MLKKNIFLFLLVSSSNSFSQEHAWVFFNAKADVDNYISNPTLMLTQRAIDRRVQQNIPIDFIDVPVDPNYINTLQNTIGIQYKTKSKWMNAAHVVGSVSDIQSLENLPFVSYVEFANDSLNNLSLHRFNSVNNQFKTSQINNKFEVEPIQQDLDYGDSYNQIEMFRGNILHEMGYKGEGIQIAVIDAGFPGVDTVSAFQHLHDNNQILGGYDFVNDDAIFYDDYSHGTKVLSNIAAVIDGEFIGTAPNASFYLYRTETVSSETPVEESYWVAAAEEADRVGVDIINTSLGYYFFDESKYNYDYQTDLDGQDSFMSRGATIAFSKGMVLVNSAGNEGGNSLWGGRIVFPADVENVLTVGAVNSLGNYSSFSSKGPTSDNRIKPDLVVRGASTYVVNEIGSITQSNGTSFASPILAGGVACLWQALPNLTNAQIISLVKESASNYGSPDNFIGYGIPNLEVALENALSDHKHHTINSKVYPNPTDEYLNITLPNKVSTISFQLYSINGKTVLEGKLQPQNPQINLSKLKKGIFFLKIITDKNSQLIKVVKK